MKAIILAGGKGLSPSPYNQVFPKPLLPVGEVPIMKLALLQLKKNGFTEVHIVAGKTYGQLIRGYFQEGEEIGLHLHYHWEDSPKGTAGALLEVEEIMKETFLVMNGDVLTTMNFQNLVTFHKERESLFTVAAHNQGIYLDFGFILVEGDQVTGYREKPTLDRWISSGIYVMEPEIFDFIPRDEVCHIPEVVATLISQNRPPLAYEDKSYWLDISHPDDFEKANRDFDKIKEHFTEL